MKLILLLLLLLIGLGLFEMVRHSFHRRRIPIRIHVNGSRGKSSVTRLIAAGLRSGGIRTLAKTTGSAACLIHADGSESPVRRRGAPNIREQLATFRAAVAEKVQALVLECMAIRPDLQQVCEHGIVHATVGVITNARPDHVEVMGPSLEDVAANLAGTVPRESHLVFADEEFAPLFSGCAESLGSTWRLSDPTAVSPEELGRFDYVEFPENVSLALDVCAAAGVERKQALAGMWQVRPDVGALTRVRCRERDKEIEFINAFAANDPVSYIRIWDRLQLADRVDETILLMNIRADRQRRSKDLAPLFGRELRAGFYVLIGEETGLFADMLKRQGLAPESMVDLGGQNAALIWGRLLQLAGSHTTVVGIGNIAGVGKALLALIDTRERAS